MKKIELSKEYLIQKINHKNKNILRALTGFIELNSKSGKFKDKIQECLNELRKVSSSLDFSYLERKSLSEEINKFCEPIKKENYQKLENELIFKNINTMFDLESTFFEPFISIYEDTEVFLYELLILFIDDYDFFAKKEGDNLKVQIISK